MTMPYGSAEEPDVVLTERESIAVHVVSSDAKPNRSIGAEYGYMRSFLIANVQNSQVATPGAVRIANRSLRRKRLIINVESGGNIVSNPAFTPLAAIATSGTAVQNLNNFPVTVTLAGFTATQVFVNGILVGAGNGTYIVPAAGSLSVTFTVVGTTTTNAPATQFLAQSPLDGVILGSRDYIQNSDQAARNPYLAGSGGGFYPINNTIRWECQAELWACYPVTNVGPVLITVSDEQYASEGK